MYATIDERFLTKRLVGTRLKNRIDKLTRDMKKAAKNNTAALSKLRTARSALARELKCLNTSVGLLYSSAQTKRFVDGSNALSGYKSTELEQLALKTQSARRHVCVHDKLSSIPGGDKPGSQLMAELDDFVI